MLKGKKILLGISGSIAAYKAIIIVRQLVKAGAEVKVIMTPAAKDFVSSLTLSTLSRNKVLIELFDEDSWNNHVMLGRWADIMLIAPLSCNTLAKMANGLCDNLLLAVYLSATCPIAVAPAMDEDMWKHPATQKNIEKILSYGNRLIPVESGELASGLTGEGRMAEPETIISFLENSFFLPRDLSGKRVLVTAGPTYEAIDPVRFVGNYSSGKMGIAIAKELNERGAEVTLVLGPSSQPVENNAIKVRKVRSAEDMFNECIAIFPQTDIAIMSAAVADYTPVNISSEKIKKKADTWELSFKKTRDILQALGEQKRNNQFLVGFALETNNERDYALTKLKQKNADMIVMNSLRDEGAGFGYDTNKITIFDRAGKEYSFSTKSKAAVAKDIVDTVTHLINA